MTFDDLIGCPWVDRGRDPAVGLDCVGLVVVALRRLGYAVPDPQASVGDPSIAEDAWRWFDEVAVEATRPDDVVRVHPAPGRGTDHVGVLRPGRRVLASVEPNGVVLLPWAVHVRRGIVGAYRPRREPRA